MMGHLETLFIWIILNVYINEKKKGISHQFLSCQDVIQ